MKSTSISKKDIKLKRIRFLFIFFFCSLCVLTNVSADPLSKTLMVTAAVPNSIAVAISSMRVNGTAVVSPIKMGMLVAAGASVSAATASSGVALSFDPLTFNNASKIWLPDHYFTLDIGPTGGPGSTDVVLTYTEGANPNAPGHGIGWKTTATFMRATVDGGGNTIETPLTAHGPKRMLIELNGEHITPGEITNQGWLRVYIGVVSKDPGATFQDPANSEVFSNVDHPGYYDGALVITATVS